MNKKQIYYIIAEILSLDFRRENAQAIIQNFPKRKEDWEKLVHLASNHLVLQTVFCSLKRNDLINSLPTDLSDYLQYIYNLNVERNKGIVHQAKVISDIFQRDGIANVFLKGTGNIFDDLYGDIGERILYDIDILVEEGEMISAVEALMENGYKPKKSFNPKASKSTMHYPLLVNEEYVAGVEIHRLPVQYHYINAFSHDRVFESKKKSSSYSGIWVMSDSNKVVHNFIHSQLMHNAHYHADVSLRDLYDLLMLSKRIDITSTLKDFGRFIGASNGYSGLMYKVFQLPKPSNHSTSVSGNLFLCRHRLTLCFSGRVMSIYHFLVRASIKYVALPIRVMFSKNARNYVFSRLSRKSWYREHINAYKRKYFKSKEDLE
jgi:hypothetical protein